MSTPAAEHRRSRWLRPGEAGRKTVPGSLRRTDATRHVYPDARIYTYWVNAHAFSRDHGFRMDFLLLSAEATSRLIAAGVDTAYRAREKPSDHAPTWVHLSEASNER